MAAAPAKTSRRDIITLVIDGEFGTDHGTEDPIAAMAREVQHATIAGQHAERWIIERDIAIGALEIKNGAVERECLPHAATAERRDDCHEFFGLLSPTS